MRLFLLVLTVTIFILSCKKNNQSIQEEYLACLQNALDDTTLIAGRLAGNWKLDAQSCRFGTTEQTGNIRISFSSNRTFTVRKDGVVVTEGTWYFRDWGGAWSLQTDEFVPYFGGAIMMCDKILVFSAMPVDGCNYYFRKTL